MQALPTSHDREPHEHWVQFYETDSFLADTVTRFLVDGFSEGEAALIIATEAHRRAFVDAFRDKGIDVEDAIARKQLVMIDAAATMDLFMVDGMPEWARFERNVGGHLQAVAQPGTRGIRAYGEMVDLLWRGNQHAAAISLEDMWNDLRKRYEFKLLCAYVIDSFYKQDGLPAVCATHSHVLMPERRPSETASVPPANAHALVSEIARRIEIEGILRTSLRELRKKEEEVRRVKDDLEDFLDTAPVAIHRVGRDGTILYANRAELDLLGYTAAEMVGHHIAEFHVDDDVIADILMRLSRGETLRDYDARLRAKDGSIRYIQVTSNMQVRDGEFVSTRCFTRDVTAQRQTALLHALTAVLSRALTADQVARIVIQEACGLVGVPAGGVILLDDTGTEIERFIVDGKVHPATAARVAQMQLAADLPICEAARSQKLVWIAGAEAIDARYPHLKAMRIQGDVRTWGAVPIVFEGRTLGAIGFRCNHDRPLQADEESMLVAVGRQCGMAIERAKLHDAAEAAREHAERASRAKDEFLAMLGHELRNPLSPILTAVQLMRLRGDQSSTREQNIIERQVNHLIHLVDDLLDISRIARGKVELEKRPLKLANVLTKAVEIVAPLCEERRHALTIDAPDAEVWIEADETRLCQVITNLLTNAAKYTNPGGQVELRVTRDDSIASIHVKDNGNGIVPELLPRIFDLFVQGSRTTDRSQGGLGIGLALVRNLVEMHGGTVSASSPGPGRGSEFVVSLPIIDLRKATGSLETDRNIRQRIVVDARKVLVVDDNVDAAELLGEMLRSVGHEVMVVHEGQQALDVLKHFKPDVAILDIGLPDTDGYQLAQALRARLGSSIRLMALTGYGQPQDRERAQAAGFEHHFTKPVGLGKVIAAIEVG